MLYIDLKVHKNENFLGFEFEFFTISLLVSRAPDSAAETRAPACQFFLCFLDPPPPCAQGGGEGRGLPSA